MSEWASTGVPCVRVRIRVRVSVRARVVLHAVAADRELDGR